MLCIKNEKKCLTIFKIYSKINTSKEINKLLSKEKKNKIRRSKND